MLRKLRERTQEERGFTLIELLVVILIIGILAAIAIPSFLNQRSKGQDAEAKSAVKTAQTAMETRFTDEQDYTGTTPANLVTIEETLIDAQSAPGATGLAVTDATTNAYTVAVTSASGSVFFINRFSNGSTTRTCTGSGGCNGGDW